MENATDDDDAHREGIETGSKNEGGATAAEKIECVCMLSVSPTTPSTMPRVQLPYGVVGWRA